MKKMYAAVILASTLMAGSAFGTVIETEIEDTSSSVLGGSGYDLDSMSVSLDTVSGELTVSIDSDAYFDNWVNSKTKWFEPASLLLSTSGETDVTSISDWDYAINLNGEDIYSATSGTVSMYETTGDADDFDLGISRSEVVGYDPESGQEAVNTGESSWSVDDSTLTLSLIVSDDFLSAIEENDYSFGLSFSQICGNDMLTGVTDPVPEPATMVLFGLGLAGLGLAGRRRML